METILIGIGALACPVGMGLMMWFVARGMHRGVAPDAKPADVNALRAEHQRLGEEIDRLESQHPRTLHEVAR